MVNVHHASCQRVVVDPVELQGSSPSSLSNECRADRGQDARHPGRQALNVHHADPAHVVFEHVNLPSSDRHPESWFRHQAAVRRGVWIGSQELSGDGPSSIPEWTTVACCRHQNNPVMQVICREIWPDETTNPFAHGAFGSYIIYYAGTISGAPCIDMDPVNTIDTLI